MTTQDALTPTAVTQDSGVREIGSDFELVDDVYLLPNGASPSVASRMPWDDSAEIIYVQSGRQALAFAEAELRHQGHSHIHVPSYLCDSMITPFQRTGWTLSQLPVDSDLAVNPTDLLTEVTAGVLLHTPYFGRQDSPATLAALDTLRRRGVVVVVDETHRLFSGPSQVADIRVASLRKLLPLYDGGYVVGLSRRSAQNPLTGPAESVIADLRQMASISKSNALASGDSNKDHLALFAKAEHATDSRPQPAQMSSASHSLLHRLDLDRIRATRRANAILLTLVLGQSDRFRVINPPAENLLPSHLVLETDSVRGLRQYLTGREIFCPVHWPPSEVLPRTGDWPNRYISLPIDHRYDEPDMRRIGNDVKEFFNGGLQEQRG